MATKTHSHSRRNRRTAHRRIATVVANSWALVLVSHVLAIMWNHFVKFSTRIASHWDVMPAHMAATVVVMVAMHLLHIATCGQ